MLVNSSASSKEILIYTELNHYELFRISEDSYRLSFYNPIRYMVDHQTFTWNQFEIDYIGLTPATPSPFGTTNVFIAIIQEEPKYGSSLGY